MHTGLLWVGVVGACVEVWAVGSGQEVGRACVQGPYHLHSPDSAGSPLWTLLQCTGDPRLQKGDWMRWGAQLGWTADPPP